MVNLEIFVTSATVLFMQFLDSTWNKSRKSKPSHFVYIVFTVHIDMKWSQLIEYCHIIMKPINAHV